MTAKSELKDIERIQDENFEALSGSFLEPNHNTQEWEKKTRSENIEFDSTKSDVLVSLDQSTKADFEKPNYLLEEIDKSLGRRIVDKLQYMCKYVITASFIFVVLMLFSNYSAYITIAKSYFNPEEIAEQQAQMQKSLEVTKIQKPEKVEKKIIKEEEVEDDAPIKSMRDIIGDTRKEEVNLDIEIIPFVNRILIPKIGKNIPLVDIASGKVEGLDELNDLFMDELKGGVVRYPGSAKPGGYGNSFIFGHSSNFPWIEGDYNDVFALLDKIEIGDEVVSYYEGKKYVYKIKEKDVISPRDVEVLKRDTGKKEITLMTCWPIGTTYNRLLVIGELISD